MRKKSRAISYRARALRAIRAIVLKSRINGDLGASAALYKKISSARKVFRGDFSSCNFLLVFSMSRKIFRISPRKIHINGITLELSVQFLKYWGGNASRCTAKTTSCWSQPQIEDGRPHQPKRTRSRPKMRTNPQISHRIQNLLKMYPQISKISFLLHFWTLIFKSQRGPRPPPGPPYTRSLGFMYCIWSLKVKNCIFSGSKDIRYFEAPLLKSAGA